MTTESNPAERIRRRRRRATGGLSSSTEARSSTPEADVEDPENDLEVSDLNISDEVLRQAREGQVPRDNNESETMEGFTPRNRMDDVKKRGGKYEREYRLQLLHRMLMRRVPLDEIARELDVSVTTVKNDRLELFQRLKEEAKKLDINLIIGDTMGFFAEVQGLALRTASIKQVPMNLRLAAMRTALSSRNDQNKFLQAAGVFDVLRYRMTEQDSSADLDKLMTLTEKILSGEDDIEQVQEKNPDLKLLDELEEEEIEVSLF